MAASGGGVVGGGGAGGGSSGGVGGGNQGPDGVVGDESRTASVVEEFHHSFPTTLKEKVSSLMIDKRLYSLLYGRENGDYQADAVTDESLSPLTPSQYVINPSSGWQKIL